MRWFILLSLCLVSCGPTPKDAPKCGAETCSGCCAGGVCQAGTGTSACGTGGVACAACSANQNCTTTCYTCLPPAGQFVGVITLTSTSGQAACPSPGATTDNRTFNGSQSTSVVDSSGAGFTCTTTNDGCNTRVVCTAAYGDGTIKNDYTFRRNGKKLTGTMVSTGTGAYCPTANYSVDDSQP